MRWILATGAGTVIASHSVVPNLLDETNNATFHGWYCFIV